MKVELETPGGILQGRQINAVAEDGFKEFVEKVLGDLGTIKCCTISNVTLSYVPFIEETDWMPRNLTARGREEILCYLRSPWVDADTYRGADGVLNVSAVFRYSLPQLAADQAYLSGLRGLQQVRPVTQEEFLKASHKYSNLMTTSTIGEGENRKLLAEIQPGLIWLFSETAQSTRGPFFAAADARLRRFAKNISTSQAEFSVALLSSCLPYSGKTKEIFITDFGSQALSKLKVGGAEFQRFVESHRNFANK